MKNSRQIAGLLLVLSVLSTSVEVAEAQSSTATRIIVLRFEGRGSSRARRAVIQEVSSLFEIVEEEQAVVTAEQMGVDVSSPGGMAEVVRELGVTLVVTGSVTGRRRRAITTIVVVDPDGNELSRRQGPEPRRARDRTEIARLAVEAINEANAVLEQQRAAAEAAANPPPPQRIIYDDEDDDEDSGSRSGWRHPLVQALGGLRLRTVGTYVEEGGRELFFEADIYPEIELLARFRPWTDDADEGLRGIQFGVQGAFSVGISYFDTMDVERDMTSFRFRLDVGYGYTVGDIFEISGVLGFGTEGVLLTMPDAFPSTLFSFLRVAVVGRVRAHGDLFMVEGGLGGRIGLDGGELASAFGPSMFFGGMDMFLGFAGNVPPGFSWAARFGYQLHSISFDGGGGSFGNGSGGTDEAIEIRLLVGVAF